MELEDALVDTALDFGAWAQKVTQIVASALPAADTMQLSIVERDAPEHVSVFRRAGVTSGAVSIRAQRQIDGELGFRLTAGSSRLPTPNEREFVGQAGFKIENALRARRRPESIRGHLDGAGAIVWKNRPTPIWPALLSGELSLAPTRDREHYAILEVRSDSSPRAVPDECREVIRMMLDGASSKVIAYDLALSPGTVHRYAGRAAAMMGFRSAFELCRLAPVLSAVKLSPRPAFALTASEREVLTLVHSGLSNAAIARARGRSVHTIANQLASLLRKTGCGSRRQLVVRRILDVETPLSC